MKLAIRSGMSWNRIFSAFYDRFMSSIERKYLDSRRKRLISGLSGKIFEVGVGTGVNFKYYKNDIILTGIEPSPYMIAQAVKRKDILISPEKITLHNIGCGSNEMDQLIEPESIDAIVCTLVLCTIPDPVKALNNFMRILKPGGKLIILEHIRSHRSLGAKVQDFINPVWKIIGDGCHLNRATDQMLKDAGFRLLQEENFNIGIPFYEAVFEKHMT